MTQVTTVKDTRDTERHRSFFYRMRGVVTVSVLGAFLCVALCHTVEWGLAQESEEPISEERIVTGTGTIMNENVADARDEAISQAFSRAIEEYLVQRLGARLMGDNFQRLYEGILSRAKEQIQDYQVLTEFTTDNHVRVLIKARINTAVLEGILEDMGMRERDTIQGDVLFLVSEQTNGSAVSGWWTDPSGHTSLTLTEVLLSRVFEERGFRVINRSFFPPEESYDEGMLTMHLTDEDAVKWGKLLSAQLVLTGEAIMSSESTASVYLKAIRVKDGATLAQGFREGELSDAQGEDGSAMDLAINEWAQVMMPYILDAFKPAEVVLNRIVITLRGLKSYKELHVIKEFFTANFPEVKSVIEQRLNREFVKVSVQLQGDSQGLATRVVNHPKKPFAFDISEVNDQGFTVVRR
jgi:hypothetical protein